jgi:hypothetical protein
MSKLSRSRLNAEARHVRVQGLYIDQFTDLSAGEAVARDLETKIQGRDQTVAAGLIPEIQHDCISWTRRTRLLALGRSAKT